MRGEGRGSRSFSSLINFANRSKRLIIGYVINTTSFTYTSNLGGGKEGKGDG